MIRERRGVGMMRTKAGGNSEGEPVGGRREWDMNQPYSINTHLPHPCLIVIFVHCAHRKMAGNVWRHSPIDTHQTHCPLSAAWYQITLSL